MEERVRNILKTSDFSYKVKHGASNDSFKNLIRVRFNIKISFRFETFLDARDNFTKVHSGFFLCVRNESPSASNTLDDKLSERCSSLSITLSNKFVHLSVMHAPEECRKNVAYASRSGKKHRRRKSSYHRIIHGLEFPYAPAERAFNISLKTLVSMPFAIFRLDSALVPCNAIPYV